MNELKSGDTNEKKIIKKSLIERMKNSDALEVEEIEFLLKRL